MYEIIFSRRFKKSEKRLKYSGNYNESETDKIIKLLSQGVELPQAYRDHQLRGDFIGHRECHIESDLVLLYQINQAYSSVVLVNIGSHSDLFG
jgi:mRNA interferase YafQ